MAHCFEDCGYGRIKIQTDLLDTRSQAAIAKLGAPGKACCGGI